MLHPGHEPGPDGDVDPVERPDPGSPPTRARVRTTRGTATTAGRQALAASPTASSTRRSGRPRSTQLDGILADDYVNMPLYAFPSMVSYRTDQIGGPVEPVHQQPGEQLLEHVRVDRSRSRGLETHQLNTEVVAGASGPRPQLDSRRSAMLRFIVRRVLWAIPVLDRGQLHRVRRAASHDRSGQGRDPPQRLDRRR